MNCQFESILLTFLTSSLFIIALYIYPNKLPRNDPFTIKTRFICVTITSIILLYILNQYQKYDLNELEFDYLLSWDFVLNGLIKPLLILFVIQFVPIVMFAQNLIEDKLTLKFDIIVFRNYFAAPFAEELTYRFIILKFLSPCFNPVISCLISSFLFGFSHFHHYFLDGTENRSLVSYCCQFVFTFLFGLFASTMYLKSSFLLTPIILHSICNYLCLPDFYTIASNKFLSILTIYTVLLGIYLMVVL